MSVENFINYEAYLKLQNRQLQIFGQPATVYHPVGQVALGYENVTPSEVSAMNTDKVLGNTYSKHRTRCWINFTVSKQVLYKFNWFPDNADELCMAYFNTDVPVNTQDYVRTATPEATAIWGDMLFTVEKIVDTGLTQVLQRTYFLRPTNNLDLHAELAF